MALLAAFSSYCYSEVINGNVSNSVSAEQQWVMQNVLPQQLGLTVGAVSYQYTTIKEAQDNMIVSIRNKDALSPGYVFNQQDDWSGLPGNTIRKVVPVNDIPINRWGNGEIAVEGKGSVVNASVGYSYQYDTCADPIQDPRCPGYDAAMKAYLDGLGLLKVTDVVDPLDDENVRNAMNNKTEVKEEDEQSTTETKEEKEKKQKDKKRLQIALSTAADTLAAANAISQAAMLEAMSNVPNFNTYLQTNMPGGVYADSSNYKPTTVPENRKALRVGLAQQIMHDKLVDSQYKQK